MPSAAPPPPDPLAAEELSPPPLGIGPFPLQAVALDVSGACNLACRYCAEAATQPPRRPMTAAGLEAAWRLLFPDGRPRSGSSIHLGSGEPLLAMPLLRELAARIERSGGSAAEGRPDVYLTTNGTLADRPTRDWLVGSGWHVKISLDGPPRVHDRWRVDRKGGGTHARVAEAVADLAARIPDRFSVTAVLCRNADPESVFAHLAGLGAERIELVPAAHDDSSVVPGPQDVEAYRRFVERYARSLADDPEEERIPTLIRFESRVRRVLGHDLQRVGCGAGRNFLGVGPDGDLYPCFRFVGVDAFRLGRAEEGVEPRRAATFEDGAGRAYDRRRPCRECWAAPLCGGPCFACAEMFGGGDPIPLHCEYTRADARWAVWLVERLRGRDPERLLRFLPGYREALERLDLED